MRPDKASVNNFVNNLNEFKVKLRKYLVEKNKPIAIYGCGARSTNFANLLGINDLIECYIDDQREKQSKFVPGDNLEVMSWDESRFKDHFILLGVNTENEYKVMHKRGLGRLNSASILPPSRNIPSFWAQMIYD